MSDLVVFDDYSLKPDTVAFIKQYANSSYCPKQWKNDLDFNKKPRFASEEQRLAEMEIAVVYGRSLGLNLFSSLKYIAVINGQPCAWGDALVAIAQASGKLILFEEWFEGSISDETRVAFCHMKRNNGTDIVKSFSVEDAKKAKLWNKEKSVWVTYPDVMLAARARGFCIRMVFGDLIQGLITKEEAQDYPSDFEMGSSNSISFESKTTSMPRKQLGKGKVVEAEVVEVKKEVESPKENVSNDSLEEERKKEHIKFRALAFMEELREKAQELINREAKGEDIVLATELPLLLQSEKVLRTLEYLSRHFPDVEREFKEFIDKTLEEFIPF